MGRQIVFEVTRRLMNMDSTTVAVSNNPDVQQLWRNAATRKPRAPARSKKCFAMSESLTDTPPRCAEFPDLGLRESCLQSWVC